MRHSIPTLLLGACLLVSVGCSNPQPAYVGQDERPLNEAMIRSYKSSSVNQAIVRQQTLYSYHFVAGSADLSQVGTRDVEVLADHYRDHPGTLNLRRGDANEDLYNRRIQTVTNALAAVGVYGSRVAISDGLPGGDGTDSSWGVLIQDRADGTTQFGGNESANTGMSTITSR